MQRTSGESVTEIKDRGEKHQIERIIETSLECEHHTDDTADDIHRCDGVGNVSGYFHGLLAGLLEDILGHCSLVKDEIQCLCLYECFGSIPDAVIFSGDTP